MTDNIINSFPWVGAIQLIAADMQADINVVYDSFEVPNKPDEMSQGASNPWKRLCIRILSNQMEISMFRG